MEPQRQRAATADRPACAARCNAGDVPPAVGGRAGGGHHGGDASHRLRHEERHLRLDESPDIAHLE